uniref:Uncharacterized protein n=1 Tax=Rhizophora mucronata TaxID=61149 RepID=A0A2P2MZN3_RHIMU
MRSFSLLVFVRIMRLLKELKATFTSTIV